MSPPASASLAASHPLGELDAAASARDCEVGPITADAPFTPKRAAPSTAARSCASSGAVCAEGSFERGDGRGGCVTRPLGACPQLGLVDPGRGVGDLGDDDVGGRERARTDHERAQPEDELDDLDDGPTAGGQDGSRASSSVAPPVAA